MGKGLQKIVSGGQTGVDRAALDAAIESGFPHGGWVPRGRIAEDGRIEDWYQVREAERADYPVRTELNVRDSDGTLIISRGTIDGGTALTARKAKAHRRPLYVVDDDRASVERVVEWIEKNQISVLNVAGPRESKSPGIYDFAKTFMLQLLRACSAADEHRG